MKKSNMKATSLRSVLIFIVIMALGLAGVGFYLAYGWMKDYAAQVNATVIESSSSGQSISSLGSLQSELAERASVVTTANALIAPSSTYQTQVIKDIYTYASDSGITISDIDLSAAATASVGGAPTEPVTLTLASPVQYTNLLKFMTYIEGSIPKMQIAGIDISRSTGDPSSVAITSLTINVYVR